MGKEDDTVVRIIWDCMILMNTAFGVDELIQIAKRENNQIRNYLYVNPIQGKHIPVSPTLSLTLFKALAEKVEKTYQDESLLVIGFAETATAIGATIAYSAHNVKYYMNTTREDIPGAEYLFFTESHSHATEQRLVINGLSEILTQVDRIVFAEDEVTTGNTIEKLIRVLKEQYGGSSTKFGIISILNSMPEQRLQEIMLAGTVVDYLYRVPVEYRIHEVDKHIYEPLKDSHHEKSGVTAARIPIGDYWNCRIAADTETMRLRCDRFVEQVIKRLPMIHAASSILVLGTEECMFPGMLAGYVIEKRWRIPIVRFHATTRSPIEVSPDVDYPLHNRSSLRSVYGIDRKTFIYNLEKYDLVLIVSDAVSVPDNGLQDLTGALEEYGNNNMILIQWGEFDHAEQLL